MLPCKTSAEVSCIGSVNELGPHGAADRMPYAYNCRLNITTAPYLPRLGCSSQAWPLTQEL